MKQNIIRITILVLLAAALVSAIIWVMSNKKTVIVNPPNDNSSSTPVETPRAFQYKNDHYGFAFSLPDSWQGYSIVTGEWIGNTNGDQGEIQFTQGPLLSIRHPQWTKEIPRQDIPVMVFTLSQWQDLQADRFHIGAAPIGPSELGRNTKYVFGLPARYNFAFPVGYEEVDQLIRNDSFHAFDTKS